MSKPHLYLSVFVVIFFSLSLPSCKKDKSATFGSCSGNVVDQYNNPIANATITINAGTTITSETDASGRFLVQKVPTGQVSVTASASSYISNTKTISINTGNNTEVDFKLTTGTNALTVSPDTIKVSPATQISNFNVTSNTSWTIVNAPAWLGIKSLAGNGNQPVALNITQNTDDTSRIAKLSVSAGTLSKTVVVIQRAPIKLLSVPNGTTLIGDSVSLVFNMPVTVKTINPLYTLCIGDNGYTYFNNNSGVKFHYGCGLIGGSYPFAITVYDAYGDETTINFTVQYYTQRFDYSTIGGANLRIVQMMDTGIWTFEENEAGDMSNTLAYFDIPSLKLEKEFKLNFTFSHAAYNPVDNLIYIPAYGTNNIYVINPADGSVSRTITLTPVSGDDPASPRTTVLGSICFFANGKAIINVGVSNLGDGALKVLDTRASDNVAYVNSGYDLSQQAQFAINYNGTKMYTDDYNAGSYLYVIDSQTLNVIQYLPPQNSRLAGVVPSRLNNNMLVYYYFGDYIWNAFTSGTSTGTFTAGGLADFVNRPGMDMVGYVFGNNNLYVCNFASLKTLYQYPTTPSDYESLGNPYVTKDGKYVVVLGAIDIGHMFLFDTRCFFKN